MNTFAQGLLTKNIGNNAPRADTAELAAHVGHVVFDQPISTYLTAR